MADQVYTFAEPGGVIREDRTISAAGATVGDVLTVQADESIAPATPAVSGVSSVTDGSTTVDPATSIDFTSGATVTDGGSGVAQVAVGGSQTVQTVTVHLLAADILALDSVPFELVAEPDAGKAIIPLGCICHFTPGLTPYTDTGTSLSATGPPGSFFIALPEAEYMITTTDESESFDFLSTASLAAVFAPPSAATFAFSLTASAPITDGDGTLDVTTIYMLVDLP